jgi:hypothetical protein
MNLTVDLRNFANAPKNLLVKRKVPLMLKQVLFVSTSLL